MRAHWEFEPGQIWENSVDRELKILDVVQINGHWFIGYVYVLDGLPGLYGQRLITLTADWRRVR